MTTEAQPFRIAIVHEELSFDAGPDGQDTILQAQAIADVLRDSGAEVEITTFPLNLDLFIQKIEGHRPHLIFNLVESYCGTGRLIHLAPAIYESLGIPFTGTPSSGMLLTTNKILSKQILRRAGLDTADWLTFEDLLAGKKPAEGRYIVKSVWEDASIGIDASSVVTPDGPEALLQIIVDRQRRFGGEWFAEAFIDGREFNLSLLANPKTGSVDVMPPAEIEFNGFSPDMPRIVDYRAKWAEGTQEYQGTPRTFKFRDEEKPLLKGLKEIAVRCWRIFGLDGYARVDFRVDQEGRPFILEINANPCITPGAGFPAATSRGGLNYPKLVARIRDAALRRGGVPRMDEPQPPPRSDSALRSRVGTGKIRTVVRPEDVASIRSMVADSGFFNEEEIDIAVELAEDAQQRKASSEYKFVLLDDDQGNLVGYACYGHISGTESSYDLYWIAVDPTLRAQGYGARIMKDAERRIAAAGGQRVYVDTASREQYAPTRKFYESLGYRIESLLPDFYSPGDGKVVYCKRVAR